MEKIIEIIPENIPDWALDAMNQGQLWKAVFDKIEYLEREVASAERDRAQCLEIFTNYYKMNVIGNKQEFTDAHNHARRYLESNIMEGANDHPQSDYTVY